MDTEKQPEYVTVDQIAVRLGKKPRMVQRDMQTGKPLPHIIDYKKVHPEKRNSPYLARPRKSFFRED